LFFAAMWRGKTLKGRKHSCGFSAPHDNKNPAAVWNTRGRFSCVAGSLTARTRENRPRVFWGYQNGQLGNHLATQAEYQPVIWMPPVGGNSRKNIAIDIPVKAYTRRLRSGARSKMFLNT